ncbi:hypothetical protein ULF88_04965 [Halopseudomonas pachastrellae]|nr:hypothetical protein [Halopseudomonas pachastrellae]
MAAGVCGAAARDQRAEQHPATHDRCRLDHTLGADRVNRQRYIPARLLLPVQRSTVHCPGTDRIARLQIALRQISQTQRSP